MDPTAGHVPVMLEEVLEHLAPRPGHAVLDGTAGGGGHAAALLERVRPGGRLVLADRDPEAVDGLRKRFGREPGVLVVHANFCDLDAILAEAGLERLDRALADLGVSSLQLADAARGFSFDRPGPLDMRLDPGQDLTAREIVNRWDVRRLEALLRQYADQPFARRIARALVEARGRRPLERTDELAEVVRGALPPKLRRGRRLHPATRVFMALRIAVNDEFGSLDRFCCRIFDFLNPGGRVGVLAFHSGEDRIVKRRFREAARTGLARLPFAKPLTPAPRERRANPRSRSAKLRVAEAVPAPPAGSA